MRAIVWLTASYSYFGCVPLNGSLIENGAPPLDSGVEVDSCDAGAPCLSESDVCSELVAATCEPTCQESAACAAATLLSQYEPLRCGEALVDAQTFPHCGASSCETLVAKVCGGDPPSETCRDNPGCEPAIVLHARAIDPAATTEEIEDALAACADALEDEAIFAPCG